MVNVDFLSETLAGDEIKQASGQTSSVFWSRPEAGVILFEPVNGYQQQVIISVAVHGNETAPVEIVNRLISAILSNQYLLKVRLLVVFGNLDAMRQGKRYLNIDLNRLFSDHHLNYDSCYETQRAAMLQKVVNDFYKVAPDKPRLHFDLHTAIRASQHATFGLLPFLHEGSYQPEMLTWLQSVGLEALVVNHESAATFSYFTSKQFSANSCTLELGKAKPFGENDLQQFTGIEQGIINLITGKVVDVSGALPLSVYNVADVIIKHSDQFTLNIRDDVANFTEFPKGYLLATDFMSDTETEVIYQVENEPGYILFPNKNVKNGLRAGLLLAKSNFSLLEKGEL
ncbi:succinylglutamate desuccinylase [Psychromonas marina]|uniref:Succinylglutamate desuccinylase n=1 Tax=Psychromonas marina TaxID=88364 RepID=A0ABQ6E2N8_9GAMM|nr:succinylglutamate desuccinylase [Psychromonas marina]GLS91626.1 succinylglutamate desuccinylase [Psychromonas marina]